MFVAPLATPVTVTLGSVVSILNAALSRPGLLFPTLSSQAPDAIFTAAPSCDPLVLVNAAAHGDFRPDPPSEAADEFVTAVLYQPAALDSSSVRSR